MTASLERPSMPIITQGIITDRLRFMSAGSNRVCHSELGLVFQLPRDCQARLITQVTAPALFGRTASMYDGKRFLPLRVNMHRPLTRSITSLDEVVVPRRRMWMKKETGFLRTSILLET